MRATFSSPLPLLVQFDIALNARHFLLSQRRHAYLHNPSCWRRTSNPVATRLPASLFRCQDSPPSGIPGTSIANDDNAIPYRDSQSPRAHCVEMLHKLTSKTLSVVNQQPLSFCGKSSRTVA